MCALPCPDEKRDKERVVLLPPKHYCKRIVPKTQEPGPIIGPGSMLPEGIKGAAAGNRRGGESPAPPM